MFRAVGPIVACVLMATIVGCSAKDPVADDANAAAILPSPNANVSSPDGSPPQNAAPSTSKSASPSIAIPPSLQGRWGLTPADCTSNLGDAKGLLIVNSTELRFYESRAVPGRDIQSDSVTISGNFDFTGEGQTWSKFEALELHGHDLVRTELNPTASFTYAKCT